MWIDADHYDTHPGDVRFLVEVFNTSTGGTRWSLQDRPLRTNRSLQPRLTGWCGETNNRSRTAHGLVRVVRVTPNDRALVTRLRGAALDAALEEVGYPGLEVAL
jgi:hypothetical protein